VQRCLSTVVAVANLCGPMVIRLKTGKLAGSPSFKELPRTSHHRAMYVMYYASMLRCWQLVMILVKTNHP
jgi:hypothetical protein